MIDRKITNCKGKCRLNPVLHYCIGCFRTLEHITNWAKYSQEERDEIIGSEIDDYIDDDRESIFTGKIINN
jgi:predicted Fe-S protein YdhL (DUF1289 family)